MTAEVRFVDGPAAGLTRDYPGETPPDLIPVYGALFRGQADPDDEVETTTTWYQTQPNPSASGSPWVAVVLP